MTVDDLIAELQNISAEGKGGMDVKFSYNYGDHWRTTVAEGISDVSEAHVKHSDYHNRDKVYDEGEDDEKIYHDDGSMKEGFRQVILLN